MGAYALSKTALLGLTKLMALELGPRGVRVNCICPGLIETRFGEAVSCIVPSQFILCIVIMIH